MMETKNHSFRSEKWDLRFDLKTDLLLRMSEFLTEDGIFDQIEGN